MEPRTRTILLILLGAALALGVGCYLLAVKAYDFVFYKPPREEKPHLYATPEPLELQDCNAAGGTALSFFGYLIRVPWTGVKSETADEDSAGAFFESRNYVYAHLPAEKDTPLGHFNRQTEEDRRNVEALLGPEALRSNYNFYRALFSVTPSDLSFNTPYQRLIGLRVLLTLKDMHGGDAATGLHSFETPHVKGFQLGDPGRKRTVKLLVFGTNDQFFSLSLGRREGRDAAITQDELNCIIQSIRPAEEPKK